MIKSKNIFLNLIVITVIFTLSSCALNRYQYFNRSPYSDKNIKEIYISPIVSLQFKNAARKYFAKGKKDNRESVKDSVEKFLNYRFQQVSSKYLNKRKALIHQSSFKNVPLPVDSVDYIHRTISNPGKSESLNIAIPNREFLIKNGIECRYALFLTELTAYKSTCAGLKNYGYLITPIAIPMCAPSDEPSIKIKGTLILWDYNNDVGICAGGFDVNLNTIDILNEDAMVKASYTFFARVLVKTKYWDFPNLYVEE